MKNTNEEQQDNKIGKQYPNDKLTDTTGFLADARFHQSKYRASKLCIPYEDYGNYLTKADALKGLNFYDDFGVFDEVKKRYPNYSKPLYSNMLRSEHIGFNLFIPLSVLNQISPSRSSMMAYTTSLISPFSILI